MHNPNKPKLKKKHPVRNTVLIILAVLVLYLAVIFVLGIPRDGKNPHHLAVFDQKKIETLDNAVRLDKDGNLYSVNYTADYHSLFAKAMLNTVQLAANNGCTVYTTHDTSGNVITCRNYDYPHVDAEGEPTGLNVVLTTAPEGGYRSIAMADIAIFQEIGLMYCAGDLDDGKTDISMVLLLPWFCMDGMNEKGLSGTVLYVDVAEGENAIKRPIRARKPSL